MSFFGLFKKASDILESNLSDLLSEAEDPRKLAELYIERAQEKVTELNKQVNAAVAKKIEFENKVKGYKSDVDSWGKKASSAVQNNRDDLAIIALEKQEDAQANATRYQGLYESQKADTEKLQQVYKVFERKLREAIQKRDEIVARSERAEALEGASDALSKLAKDDGLTDLNRLEDKVAKKEASAQAASMSVLNSAENQFDEMEELARKSSIQDKLAKLKAEQGKQ